MKKIVLKSALLLAPLSLLFGFTLIDIEPQAQVQVRDFEAYMIDDVAFVTWMTANENGGREVRLEKSENGIDFEGLETFKTNGEQSKYTFVDHNPSFGVSYYRVKYAKGKSSEHIVPLINHDGPISFNISTDAESIQLTADLSNEKTCLVSLIDDSGMHYFIQSITFKNSEPVVIETKEFGLDRKEYILKVQANNWSADKRIRL